MNERTTKLLTEAASQYTEMREYVDTNWMGMHPFLAAADHLWAAVTAVLEDGDRSYRDAVIDAYAQGGDVPDTDAFDTELGRITREKEESFRREPVRKSTRSGSFSILWKKLTGPESDHVRGLYDQALAAAHDSE